MSTGNNRIEPADDEILVDIMPLLDSVKTTKIAPDLKLINSKRSVVWPSNVTLYEKAAGELEKASFEMQKKTALVTGIFGDFRISLLNSDPIYFLLSETKSVSEEVFEFISRSLWENIKYSRFSSIAIARETILTTIREFSSWQIGSDSSLENILRNCIDHLPEIFQVHGIALYTIYSSAGIKEYKRIGSSSPIIAEATKKRIVIQEDQSPNNESFLHTGNQNTSSSLRIDFTHPQGCFVIFRNPEAGKINTKEKSLLDTYLRLFLIKLFPILVSTLNRDLARQLIASLATEVLDSVTSSGLFLQKITEYLASNSIDKSRYAISCVYQELRRIETNLREAAQSAVPFDEATTTVDVINLVKEVIDKIGPLFDGYDINVSELASIPVRIYKNAIAAAFREIVKNIILHAYPAESKSGSKKIRFASRKESGSVIIEIADTGNGLSGEYHEKAFQPGWKLHPESPGAGMGLTYARYVVQEMHGGTLRIEPNRDSISGLRIFCSLPLDSSSD
jgi:hypothetical protein